MEERLRLGLFLYTYALQAAMSGSGKVWLVCVDHSDEARSAFKAALAMANGSTRPPRPSPPPSLPPPLPPPP